jgi:hypothetical protein
MLGELARFSFLAAAVHQVGWAQGWLFVWWGGVERWARPAPRSRRPPLPARAALFTLPGPASLASPQSAFTLLSSLPFAVGQPQDVGLIFLSSMATGVAEIGRQVRRRPG